jgi:ketosteroid isomerase-like protein
MPRSALIASLVLAGMVGTAARAATVPPPELAEAQLRALNHRFVDAVLAPRDAFLDGLAHEDFQSIGHDGAWRDRDAYLARMREPNALAGASYDDLHVRLFGPVAILHGVFEGLHRDGRVARVRYTDVYAWNGSAWLLVSAQDTPLKPGVPVRRKDGAMPALAPWTGTEPAGDDLAVLAMLNENYVNAFREADAAWYDRHLAPDYVVVYGDGSFHDRASALADFAKPTFATSIRSFPVGDVRIRRFGEIALIHAENAYELKDGRRGVSRYTDIWHKRDGRWRCVAAHITVHRAPGA